VRACQCGFCSRHGAQSFTDPDGDVVIRAPSDGLVRHRAGLGVSEHLLCARCGVYVATIMDEPQGLLATLNPRGLSMSAFADHEPRRVEYGAETAESRRARRRSLWTPARIEIAPPAACAASDCA